MLYDGPGTGGAGIARRWSWGGLHWSTMANSGTRRGVWAWLWGTAEGQAGFRV